MAKLLQIGASIKRLRKAARLTQGELAEMVGLSRGAVSNIELGNSRAKAERLFDFATALGVSMDELTGYAGESPSLYIQSLAEAHARIVELEQKITNLRGVIGDQAKALVAVERVIGKWRGDVGKGNGDSL
jgi:transcriptional regulator with XRE-family HTH domain